MITGSNSKLLSSELATHLTGRHIATELFAFSFAEYRRWLGRGKVYAIDPGFIVALHGRGGR